jgi:8-oxo-dGTP pyrophosphatase MutT (NUDIX family)
MPIISYGIIGFSSLTKDGFKYLMIRRKNSFGFIDFIRGKYSTNNYQHLVILFDEMSMNEKQLIKTNDFKTLWKNMWGIQETENTKQNKPEESISQKKFELLKNGVPIGNNDEIITLDDLINNSKTNWEETEWEFPKGRRNFQEKDLDCALREFEEETGLSKNNINIVENLIPFEELYMGSNHKSYKHKYFLGYIDNIDDCLNNYQETEVSKIEWKTFDECLSSIRPYNLEKKQLITNINKVLQEYRLY